MKKVLYLIFKDFEEIESIVPIDLLRRAGADVEVLTLSPTLETIGRSNIKVLADSLFSDFKGDFDLLAISGGSGVFQVIENKALLSFIQSANEANKSIAAICAAPLILKAAGLIDNKKCTGHSSIIAELGANYLNLACVHDANIITSQGAGTAFEFAFELIKILFGEEKLREVAQSICYKR